LKYSNAIIENKIKTTLISCPGNETLNTEVYGKASSKISENRKSPFDEIVENKKD
jgi:hypothetical protein